MSDKVAVDELVDHYKALKNEIHKVIVGQDDVVDQVLISIFSRGHCLLVGVRLISSAKMILLNKGPLMNLKFRVSSKISDPTISDGIKSGVN